MKMLRVHRERARCRANVLKAETDGASALRSPAAAIAAAASGFRSRNLDAGARTGKRHRPPAIIYTRDDFFPHILFADARVLFSDQLRNGIESIECASVATACVMRVLKSYFVFAPNRLCRLTGNG
jgi:hypothetical protein